VNTLTPEEARFRLGIHKQEFKRDMEYEQLHGIPNESYLLYGTSTVLYWTPGTKNVRLISEKDFASTPAHDYTRWVKLKASTPDTLLKRVLIEAMHLIIRDACCPHAVHAAVSKLRNYRILLAEDMPYSISTPD
jgi:hypothetical protein